MAQQQGCWVGIVHCQIITTCPSDVALGEASLGLMLPSQNSKSAGPDPALSCLQSCLHRTGVYLGASGHTRASILLAPHPFFLWHDRPARKQDCQGSCLALIYTLSSFCISVLYVSLFRWCVNSMYTFFPQSHAAGVCLCICIVLYFSSCSQIFIKIFP